MCLGSVNFRRFDPWNSLTNAEGYFESAVVIKKITSDGASADPHFLKDLFELSEVLYKTQRGKTQLQWLCEQSDMNSLMKENWQPSKIDLHELSQMNQGSLGKVFADNLLKEGFDPTELTDIDPYPVNSDREYLLHRDWQTHDILHTLTGFDVNPIGEIALQAFSYANCRQPVHLYIMFASMFKSGDLDIQIFESVLSAIGRGFELGCQSPLLLAYKLEEGWERPVSDWRKELNIPNEPRECDASFMRSSDFLR